MIDLNELLNRTVDIKIKDKTIKVKDITVKQFERMLDIEKEGTVKDQANLIAEILSNNTNNIKFTTEQVEKMSRPAVVYLWQLFVTKSLDTAIDPN
ncbi:hypothetical protein ACKA04_02370 [Helcococcus kunzii]|uniref:hypothetical protein n=1 Tax=Helcococcus kunzii TaxID=40091 RepID=UPI0038A02D5A